jgi:aminoglycoside phosphotransferase (APT) family kinase protein
VLDVRPLTGGWTSAMHAVDVRCNGAVRALVLRRIDKPPWLHHAAELIGREASVLELLADTPVPAARLVAFDAPRLLMTRLPGTLRLDDPPLAALARTLVAIHSVDAPARTYQSWAHGKGVPEWGDQELWTWAVAAVSGPPPTYEGCFLHRDFHAANVLFDGDEVTGVVDWVETSWGPADLDVAHCCTNLALRTGVEAAEAFRAEYVRAGGTLSGDPYWALLDLVGMLPAPRIALLEPDLAKRRLEAYARSLRASSSRSW